MVELNDLSEKIFSLLKGNGLQVKIFDEAGAETTDPTLGRRFFVVNPNIMVTIDEEDNTVEFSKGKDVDNGILSIQKNVRKLADQFMMNSKIKVFGKSIQPKDYAYQAKMKGAAMMENSEAIAVGDRVVATVGRFDVISGTVQNVDGRTVIVLTKDRKKYNLDISQCKKVKTKTMENEMKPINHHLVGEIIRMIKTFTSKNHQHHQPNGAAFHDICSNLGEEPDEVQPILNKLVQQGKVVAHPYKDYVIYSMAVDEAVMENLENISVHNLKGLDSEDAYATTQTDDNIKDGDILLVDGGIAIMYKAWPVMVSGKFEGFHEFTDPDNIPNIDGGKYADSYRKAMSLVNGSQSMMESFSRMFGSLKTSQQTLENVRILVKHKTPIDENVRGARSRHISAIFLECNGERFRFPNNYLPGARAMAQHLAHGGTMGDKVGSYIIESTDNLLKLQSFNRYVTTNKLINEDSSGIVETVKENIETIRTELKKLTGVKTYETVKARLETFEREALSEDDTSQLKDLFTIRRFDEKFEGVLPIIKQLVQEKDTFHKRIEEAATNVVRITAKQINNTPMFEFASEQSRVGFLLSQFALRIVENEELAGFVNKVGSKLVKEGAVNDFEKAIISQILENLQIVEKQSVKTEIKESVDLDSFFDKYTMNFF